MIPSSRTCHLCGHSTFRHHHGICTDPIDCLCKRGFPGTVTEPEPADAEPADPQAMGFACAGIVVLMLPLVLTLIAVWTGDLRWLWTGLAISVFTIGGVAVIRWGSDQ